MSYTLTSGASVIRDADNACIPDDPRNADWQAYQEWLAAGNTATPAPAPSAAAAAQIKCAAAITAGLGVTWATSTALNATYALDQGTQFNIAAETVSILTNSTFTNGQATRNWADVSGAFHSFTVAQFKALATAITQYLDTLATTQTTAAAGQSTSWPSANVMIDQ